MKEFYLTNLSIKAVGLINQAPTECNLLQSGQRFWEISAATIEDLAFGSRSSREPDGVGRRVCLSGASYAAAAKSEWRMALKI